MSAGGQASVAPGRLQLLAQELRGPRYTSYPSALSFSKAFTASDYADAVWHSNCGEPAALSLYLHVPFCRSNCFYCGCHRIISHHRLRIRAYQRLLLREAGLQGALVDRKREVRQVHFGGGTPNMLTLGEMGELLSALSHAFNLADASRLECSLEADPRQAGAADVAAWRALGFNRISFGVQDVDPDVQRAVNRIQSRERIADLTRAARNAGFHSVNWDLVYGLPKQTPESFAATLDFVEQARPDRIAAFHYAHLPARFPAQRAIDEADLPGLEQRLAIQALIRRRLEAAGYVFIGLDHYALPDDPLTLALADGTLQRGFQGYTTHAGTDLIGMGVSSIGKVGSCYAQNTPDLARYAESINRGELAIARGYRMTGEDCLRGAVIQSLMCQGRVAFDELNHDYGVEPQAYFALELSRLRGLDPAGELVEIDAAGVRVRPAGRSLLRVLSMAFDTHLREAPANSFSRVA